ncbi:linoleate 13S-lipoxygenase 3-1, chloroplastic-like isoform X1 [Hevea brasiliensis]|uniref:linoleate 13S-lipoxygenase 3-1, chloroplastic-like isoform X1 n=1 Tax=Hevea brasiliensis TaxID=3981 RepID=UPI0025EDEFE6|nr:linoleate 13S-lipoxygenase 3-1, chloroplastic-like isoform X1 [Hevea brasiliensis]
MAITMEGVGSFMVMDKHRSFPSFIQQNKVSAFTAFLFPSLVNNKRNHQKMMKKPRTTTVAALIFYNPIVEAVAEKPVKLKITAEVTLRNCETEYWEKMLHFLDNTYPSQGGVVFQLVSTHIDPRIMQANLSSEATLKWSKSNKTEAKQVTYEVEFQVDSNFGIPGAITVINKYHKEFYLESVNIEGVIHFACNSWVQPDKIHPEKRIFFFNKAYLPCQTPLGLKEFRESELEQLRGDGKGVRKLSDRIYDYDVYNDLGNPDRGMEYSRPTLGGENCPYPRRCRTGRHPSNTDVSTESPVNEQTPMYVPRDEALDDSKTKAVAAGKLKGLLKNLIPTLRNASMNSYSIKDFSEINSLYKRRTPLGVQLPIENWSRLPLPSMLTKILQSIKEIYKFDPPNGISRGASCCLRDDEFGRLTLRGLNPLSIERLKIFPPVSKLNPSIYGPQESSLKEEHISGYLNGMTVQQALEEKKLFILDYHDIYLPFLNRINALGERKAHATRKIFFLTPLGTLKPIAIELSLPPMDMNSPSRQVVTPPVDDTTYWLWQLAKAHVSSNDAGAHQLIHHWLRVHTCMEPFIIAAHRQLSVMHPVYKLLKPHMRDTLAINAQAREVLVNAKGIIECYFTPEKYCMEITQSAYRDWWRFDLEGLPADLIRRGLAEPDPTRKHGLRLLIEDYPYANDGLLIWSAIETLVRTYVNYYYPEASLVQYDTELQACYNEFINVGHADVSHADWWPKLSTPEDLTSFLTTILWIVTAQHAALNFGQYHYGGYIPVRPPYMRRLLPNQGNANFLADPQGHFLSSLPSLPETTYFMSVLDILSTHATDEQYIGGRKDLSAWGGDTEIIEAFYKFSMEIKKIEKEIERRNADPKLSNRCGPGIAPYELLVPSSGPGVTGRGVPNSISM